MNPVNLTTEKKKSQRLQQKVLHTLNALAQTGN